MELSAEMQRAIADGGGELLSSMGFYAGDNTTGYACDFPAVAAALGVSL